MSLSESVHLFEIIARVDSVEVIGMTGYRKKPEMLKFVIEDDEGRKIECIARDDQIMRLRPLIKENEMIHIRKFISRREMPAVYSDDSPLILIIDRSTAIKLANDNDEPKTVRFGAPPLASWGSISHQKLWMIGEDHLEL